MAQKMSVVRERRRHAGGRSVAAGLRSHGSPLRDGRRDHADPAARRSQRPGDRSRWVRRPGARLHGGRRRQRDPARGRRAGRARRRHPRHHQHVVYASQPNPDPTFNAHQPGDTVIGRFGLKARIATLDEFMADALQDDMGITSPLRPTEFPNPDGLTDDAKPGVDATADDVNLRADYVRTIAIPWRAAPDPHGQALFEQAQCSACHVPSLHTRADYPIAAARRHRRADLHRSPAARHGRRACRTAWPTATGWRRRGCGGRAPLIGLRFTHEFLHDGRAATRARRDPGPRRRTARRPYGSVQLFTNLSAGDQQTALLEFVGSL